MANNDSRSVFAQFIDQPEEATKQPHRGSSQIDRLLDWLVNRWTKSTVTARDLCIYGPRPRDKKTAISLAQTLAERGWLIALETHRRDKREWRIVAKR
jgi:hypothetical protein